MAWYNKYRPYTFEETVGQELVKKVLQNTVKTNFSDNPKIKHAYLLSGPRGTGKTSLARIFARSINCTDQDTTKGSGEACGKCDVCKNGQIDIIELDAASNTGIDNIRDLIEAANTPPFISKYKVYIIDEIHMLSKPAMNALLKTLEEPPTYLVFLLATTDPEKILNTILSRVTHLKLINHTIKDISEKLNKIAEKEKLEIDHEAIKLIAKVANGGLRDGVNLLETISHYNLDRYTETEVAQILGVLPNQRLQELSSTLISSEFTDLKNIIDEFESLGTDPEILLSQLLDYLLTRSLEGYIEGNGLDLGTKALIDVLADTLSNKSSIGSIRSALILVKLKLNQTDGNISKPELQTTNKGIEEVKQVTKSKTEENSKTLPQTNNTESSDLGDNKNSIINSTSDNFYELIEYNLANDLAAPMALKSYLSSIEIVENEEVIYLILANKSIILLLKSTKVTQWLKELAQKNNRGSKRILIITEESQEYETIKNQIKESGEKIKDLDLETNSIQSTENVSNQNTQSDNGESQVIEETGNIDTEFQVSDFYYLYASLPDGTIPKGMKLLKDAAKNTKVTELEPSTSALNTWDDALDGLDLE